jgi:hypothetical protein
VKVLGMGRGELVKGFDFEFGGLEEVTGLF